MLTNSLVLAPDLTSLYTNRAMCRFNLKDYDGVVADCTACIDTDPSSVKANYYLSKALSALGDHQTACDKAAEAYELCRHSDSDKSLVMTHDWLLKCKSERWRDAERRRVREHRDLENEVLALLARDRDETVAAAGDDEMERTAVWEEGESKMAQIREVFERARKDDDKKREVPDWLIDDISFDVMTDPIIVRPSTPVTLGPYCRVTNLSFRRRAPVDHTSAPPSSQPSTPKPSTPSHERLSPRRSSGLISH